MNSYFDWQLILFIDETVEDAGNPNKTDTDGWTLDAVTTLAQLHIPLLNEYNGGDYPYRRRYWKDMVAKLKKKGFSGENFTSDRISTKWRYIFRQYTKVKDNNGKTGRGRLKFKYYDAMHAIFIDSAATVLTDPNFIEPGDEAGIPKRVREAKVNKEDHNKLMREMQQRHNDRCEELQEQALELERQKVSLLRDLLQKANE